MASLADILNSHTNLLEDIGLSSYENFYELEKANATLRNLEDVFTSLKKTLESSYALQERDSNYLKTFNEEQELRRLEEEREQGTVEPVQPDQDSTLAGFDTSRFGSGFGLSLGRLLRGGALAGMAFLFADEIKKVAESAFKTFFQSTGFKNAFTDKVSEALGVGASGAAIGASLGAIIGRPIQGAVIGAVIALGPKIEEAIRAAGANITTAAVASYTIQGASIGALFGPKGAIVGAIAGFAIGLGSRIAEEIKQSKGQPGFFAKEMAGRSATEGEMPSVEAVPETPALGSISKRFESGRGGVATISTGRGDPGGKSYGEFQLASKTGTLQKFLESEEGRPFAQKYNLRTADIGTEEFDRNYRMAASQDTTQFAAAQKAFITRTHYEPVKNLAQQMGFNVSDPRVQEALFSQSVQHGFAGNKKILEAAATSAKGTPEEQVRAIYKARSEYVSSQTQIPEKTRESILGRYEAEQAAVQQIVPVAASPTSTTTAVVSGTQATQVARDAMVVNAPIVNNTPVSNITNISNNNKKTIVTAQSPRNTDPTFMRVQELNFA